MRIQVSEVKCQKCGAEEMHPDGDKLLIRGYKVEIDGHWYSQCLVCAGHYDKDLNLTPRNFDSSKGWF